MASRFAAQQFGEAFLTTLTQTRKLKQERELFAQEQATTNRRINLLDIYRQGLLENQQQRIELERQRVGQAGERIGLEKKEFQRGIIEFGLKEEQDLLETQKRVNVQARGQDTQSRIAADRLTESQRQFDLSFPLEQLKQSLKNQKPDRFISETIGDIEFNIAEDDKEKLTGNIEQLVQHINLKDEADDLFDALKRTNKNIDDALRIVNQFRKREGKAPLTDIEERYLRLYGRAKIFIDEGF